jgi:signal transduction histidine kinase
MQISSLTSESGMELLDLLSDPAFPQRPAAERDPGREGFALRRLAQLFADSPNALLQELVDLAVRYCGADSAGISLEEPDACGELHFRWVAVAGSFARYLNATTPRFYSPCGTCLSSGRPQIYTVSQPYYDFLGVAADPILDGLLIPWSNEQMRGTIWAVSHASPQAFNIGDYELLDSLAGFVSIALHYQALQRTSQEQEILAARSSRSHELAHAINNPLQALVNTVHLARCGGPDVSAYLDQATHELARLSALVADLLKMAKPALPDS